VCSYCGCGAEAVIAELMAEHAQLAELSRLLRRALADGEAELAAVRCAELAAFFAAHGAKEEQGLFAELALDPIATAAVAELSAEHRQLDGAFAAGLPARGEGAIIAALDLLAAHADREDTDVFPVALQVLPDGAWERMAKASQSPAD
jgi:hemerythrin-like domain-containing protein